LKSRASQPQDCSSLPGMAPALVCPLFAERDGDFDLELQLNVSQLEQEKREAIPIRRRRGKKRRFVRRLESKIN
jgi:hypothetical protein